MCSSFYHPKYVSSSSLDDATHTNWGLLLDHTLNVHTFADLRHLPLQAYNHIAGKARLLLLLRLAQVGGNNCDQIMDLLDDHRQHGIDPVWLLEVEEWEEDKNPSPDEVIAG